MVSSSVSKEVRAQVLVLESVLTHRPLPGMDRALAFPDPIQREDDVQVVLVDDREASTLELPPQIRIIRSTELETMQPDEPLPFLTFLEPESFAGKIGVRLRLSLALPDRDPAPLGEIVATFDDRDPLVAVYPTHVLAY